MEKSCFQRFAILHAMAIVNIIVLVPAILHSAAHNTIYYIILIAAKTAKYGQSRRYENIGNVNQTLYLYTYYVHNII